MPVEDDYTSVLAEERLGELRGGERGGAGQWNVSMKQSAHAGNLGTDTERIRRTGTPSQTDAHGPNSSARCEGTLAKPGCDKRVKKETDKTRLLFLLLAMLTRRRRRRRWQGGNLRRQSRHDKARTYERADGKTQREITRIAESWA